MNNNDYIPTVLIVDDDDDIRDILAYGFKASGFNIMTAESSDDALNLLENNKIDFLLTDVKIKNGSGIKLCKKAKGLYNLDVIIITGLVKDFAYEEVIAEGASDFVQKPIRLAEIVARVKNILAFRRQIVIKEIENKALKEKLENIIVGGEKKETNNIIRSIEFAPEFFQTGISILSYFGTVLRKKLPDQKAKITIEQNDLKVKMVIDTEKGEKEIIEKALDDYGLVLNGSMPIEEYTDDKLFEIELKTELRLAHARIESLKDIIEYKNSELERQYCLLGNAISSKPENIVLNVPISAIATSHVQIQQPINISTNLDLMHDSLINLSKQFIERAQEKEYLELLSIAIEKLKSLNSKEEFAKSPLFSKINKFMNDIQNAETLAGKIIKTAKDGFDICRNIVEYYNVIARWCGMPQVPKPIIKN